MIVSISFGIITFICYSDQRLPPLRLVLGIVSKVIWVGLSGRTLDLTRCLLPSRCVSLCPQSWPVISGKASDIYQVCSHFAYWVQLYSGYRFSFLADEFIMYSPISVFLVNCFKARFLDELFAGRRSYLTNQLCVIWCNIVGMIHGWFEMLQPRYFRYCIRQWVLVFTFPLIRRVFLSQSRHQNDSSDRVVTVICRF